MKGRLNDIKDVLIQYSLGNFDSRVALDTKRGNLETIVLGVNMLGEELRDTTISKNYFNSIFNSVSDMIFILTYDGMISDINDAVQVKTGFDKTILNHLHIDDIVKVVDYSVYGFFKKNLNFGQSLDVEAYINTKDRGQLPVLCSSSQLPSGNDQDIKFALVIKDMSKHKEIENLVFRTIIDTQENERIRVARDLHDSLGQQLSAIKFYLGSLLSSQKMQRQRILEILSKSNRSMLDVIAELRNICFNLMPQSLENDDIGFSIRELCNQLENKGLMKFEIDIHNVPFLEKSLKIAIFRIVQEFINNSLKHANSTLIKVSMYSEESYFFLKLTDNGSGFDIMEHSYGMGLSNVYSRVKSYRGEVNFISQIGKGTIFDINIPL